MREIRITGRYMRRLAAPAAVVFLLSLAVPGALGQATTATLVGTVTDTSGAALSQATVTITNQNTGQSYTHQTNESGNYEFTLLPPGVYAVEVADQGFANSVTKGVPATVNTTNRTDVRLNPGSAAQTVTVTDRAPALQTDRADVSAQIETKQVSDLPVGSSRNFQALESLVPGVSAPIYDHSSFFDAQNSQSFQVNGQAELANNLQLEGIDDNERTGLLQVYIPPAAAIQTVDVETSNYAPEFGRAAGAVTNVVLKSGSNQFHGSAYEFNEVSTTGARSYFNNTGKFPRFTNNYYGATVGGPIIKDRTFFFGNFLRYNNHSSAYNLFTVPTGAFRSGDLSASPTPIYDPATGNADGTGRQQFSGNRIDPSRFSPVAMKILNLVPLPNIAGAGTANNFQENLGFDQDSTQFDVKFDQRLRAEDHLTYRYSWQRVTTFQQPAFGAAGGPVGGGFQGTGTNTTYNTAGEYTHVFSPRLLTAVRVGVNHYRNNARQTDYGTDASTALGIPGVNVSAFTSGLAGISIPGYAGATLTGASPLVGYSASIPWDRGESNIDAANNWNYILGDHSLKFGFEVRRVRDNLTQGQTFSPRGIFEYAEGQTGLNAPDQKTSFGNDFASFLLDLPNTVGRDVNVGSGSWRQTLYFGYLQDTWQATHKLTLTYGLRWEFYPPANPDRKGGFSQYDPADNTLHVSGYGDVADDLGLPVRWTNFEPRVGAAYRASARTVVRAGFGISHTPFQDNNYAYNYPVRQNVSFNSTSSYLPAVRTDGSVATLENGFPPAPVPAIPANGIITDAPKSSAWNVVNPDYKDPYVMSYNLALQQDFGHGWVADFAYVGNMGRHLPAYYNINAGVVAGAGAKGQPEYTTFGRTATTNIMAYGTNSDYNGLQVKVTRRFQNGLSWTSGLAFQKSMGFISSTTGLASFNFYLDPRRDYAPTNWDRRVTYSQSFIYELPFGKDKPWLQQGIGGAVLGGWQASGVWSADTGQPLFLTASANSLNAPGNTQVPDQIEPFHKLGSIGTAKPWFDTNAFVQPTTAAYGNTPKNGYYGPGLTTFDASLSRSIPLHESLAVQLRADAFNALNHPNFANPGVSLTSTSFGEVTGTVSGYAPRVLQFAATVSF
jgi:Carboxypeptidase regulatory-like domain